MNYGCGNVSFTGKVDKSVYDWTKRATKYAIEDEVHRANYAQKVVKQEDLDAIKQQAADMLKLLEQKAKVMHPDTVITIDQPLQAYNERYLCVHNDKLDHYLRQTPYSRTNNDEWHRLERWKVSGRAADIGADKSYGGWEGPSGKELLGLLECRIKDIDELPYETRIGIAKWFKKNKIYDEVITKLLWINPQHIKTMKVREIDPIKKKFLTLDDIHNLGIEYEPPVADTKKQKISLTTTDVKKKKIKGISAKKIKKRSVHIMVENGKVSVKRRKASPVALVKKERREAKKRKK